MDPRNRIVSADEYKKIQNRIKQDHKYKPNFITGYAVELASLTGMRVGEIAALTWKDIDYKNRVILVDKAEVYHQTSKTYTIENTKNGVVRYVPITDEIEKLLRQIHDTEERFEYLCEYVFANEKGRIHKRAMGDCARNKSYQVGLKTKSIHAYRRTINSRMKANGISTEAAAAIMGHTEDVNNSAYSYDPTDMDYKRDALEKARIC